MTTEDKELRNDNYLSNNVTTDKGVHLLGWVASCFLLVALTVLSALNYAENREQTAITKDIKKARMLHDAYEWDELNKELDQCRASSAKS